MPNDEVRRRSFLAAASAGSLWTVAQAGASSVSVHTRDASKPAVLGGQPVRSKPFPTWPIWDDADEQALVAAS